MKKQTGKKQRLGCACCLVLRAQRRAVCVRVPAVLVLLIFTGELQELFTVFSPVRFSRGQEREK